MNELVGKDVKITLVLEGKSLSGFYSRRVHILEVENGFIKCLDFLNHITYYSLNQIKSIDLLDASDYLLNKETLGKIVDTIKNGNYDCAKEKICQLVGSNVEDERLYNLLGICYEKTGDRIKASKFFRMSYYLNQSFEAAQKNLQNLASLNDNNDNIYWGIEV